jgi:DNA polymerase-3 subunit chi
MAQPMPAVTFHVNVADRVAYACRLLRKAFRLGAAVTVLGPPELLDKVDRLLWLAEPTDFVAHLRVAAGTVPTARLARTPIWLVERLDDAPSHATLVNLAAEAPALLAHVERIVEIVPADEPGRSEGRQRWRHYRNLGIEPMSHDAAS